MRPTIRNSCGEKVSDSKGIMVMCSLMVLVGCERRGICEYDATIRNEAKNGREAFEVHCYDLDSAGGCHGSLYCGRILRIVAA